MNVHEWVKNEPSLFLSLLFSISSVSMKEKKIPGPCYNAPKYKFIKVLRYLATDVFGYVKKP